MAAAKPFHPTGAWNAIIEGRPPILCQFGDLQLQLAERQRITKVGHFEAVLQ
jgi:hypothetical protein